MNLSQPQFGIRHILALVSLAAILLAGFQFLAVHVPDMFVFLCFVASGIALSGTFVLALAAMIALSIKFRLQELPRVKHRSQDHHLRDHCKRSAERANGYAKCWNLVAIGSLMVIPAITAICALPFLRFQ